jgi:hypothetical protein
MSVSYMENDTFLVHERYFAVASYEPQFAKIVTLKSKYPTLSNY